MTMNNANEYQESDDEDLQRAIALSLVGPENREENSCHVDLVRNYMPDNTACIDQTESKLPSTTISNNSDCHLVMLSSLESNNDRDRNLIDRDTYSDLTVSPPIVDETAPHITNEMWVAEKYSELREFHQLMWDATLTTESDQVRWISQGIDVRGLGKGNDEEGQNMIVPSNYLEGKNDSLISSVKLDEFAASHLPWGLLQEHGGPCGVLAAVQAELLRLLLFTNDDNANDENPSSTNISSDGIQDALAGAIAIILARVALTPSATSMDNEVSNDQTTPSANAEDQVTMTMNENENFANSDNPTKVISPTNSVRIILPNHPIDEISQRALDWDDLQPWPIMGLDELTASEMCSSSKKIQFSNKLTVYTLKETRYLHDDAIPSYPEVSSSALPYFTLNQTNPEKEHEATKITAGIGNDKISSAKRQKTSQTLLNKEITEEDTYTLEQRIQRLTRATKRFLLDPGSLNHSLALTDTLIPEQTESRSLIPLDYFRHHGGVLLLVMSVASSRGLKVVRSEFDDPVGSKLTSTFGHCGQELINLLLTGQAVSNVFDNTLKPPGLGMICRGIQSRPYIGYLSQLEAMRYCEVGTFYKSPKVPIWVVGSTSHFTVLFGEPKALNESQSDLLLEQCRRAFKGVDGGEENGFITTQQLSTVFQRLSTTYSDTSNGRALTDILDDVKIQTLAASLEVAGAGIILWDDFWKATSRLLTGASFESVVLQANGGGETYTNATGSDDDNLLLLATTSVANTRKAGAALSPPPSSPLLLANHPNNEMNSNRVVATQLIAETDEEMARRLAREWEQESSTTATTITTATTAASASATTASAVGMSVLTEAVARIGSPMETDSTSAKAGAASYSPFVTSTTTTMMLSDEELARKLQAEWDSEFTNNSHIMLGAGDDSSVTALNGSPAHNDQSTLFSDGDEDKDIIVLNQKVTENFTSRDSMSTPPKIIGYSHPNNPNNGAYNTTNMSTVEEEHDAMEFDYFGSSKPPALRKPTQLDKDDVATMSTNTSSEINTNVAETSSRISSNNKNSSQPLELEKYGNSFAMYHYNGLQGGSLTPFRVTRLTADEAVGSSIALTRASTGGGVSASSSPIVIENSVNIAQDLEDVVRTKWPSCVIHWTSLSSIMSEEHTKNNTNKMKESHDLYLV